MSRFYIGLPVRIVAARTVMGRSNIGKEGFVNELDCLSADGTVGYGVTIDGDAGWHYIAGELEPIQRSDNQISEILAMKDLPNRDCKIARVGECV